MSNKKIVVKALVLLACLFMLSASTAFSQDPCQSYHDRYRVCVEKRDAGREVDYNVCKISPCNDSESNCTTCGCYWRADKEACMTDICISENSGDDMVSAPDYGTLKKEYLRTDCPTTPDVPAPSPVPKTGQTSSYATGDDGDLEKGVEWPDLRFIDHGDTVTDNLTGLMWTKDAQEISGTMTWPEALTACNDLELGGHSDWRLPNVKELLSLIDYSQYLTALPLGHPFDSVMTGRYWSSTTFGDPENEAINAWIVYMHAGNVDHYDKFSNINYVWPARGGQ